MDSLLFVVLCLALANIVVWLQVRRGLRREIRARLCRPSDVPQLRVVRCDECRAIGRPGTDNPK